MQSCLITNTRNIDHANNQLFSQTGWHQETRGNERPSQVLAASLPYKTHMICYQATSLITYTAD